jgi:hypothetical protein
VYTETTASPKKHKKGALLKVKTFSTYEMQKFLKQVVKHAEQSVLFRIKNNETCQTSRFASKQNFAKQPDCFAK